MGGGGKGGGGGHTPIEQPNTLESAQRLKIIDLLCEGVASQDVSFKNIYLDNTPIQNSDGSYNFTGIRVSALPGTHNQDYLAGFDSTDKIVGVGTEVKAATPITRTVTDPLVDSVRVTLALGSLVTMKDNGDRVGGSVSLTVMCGNKSYPVTISGKTTSAYHQDVTLTDLPDAPFNISVHRNTPDSATDKTSNATHWVSYVESIDAKFNYPNSVVVGLEIDSAQFGGKIPARTYLNKWTQIKVPSNYNPITRTYEGIWLGEFKTAWSNNPAWVFYDLVTDKRYGLGDRLGEFGCDKWSLYQIAKYCDQIVPDGFGGHEPRFTCNAYLSEPRDAKALLDDLASVFRGIAVWDGQMVTALQDAKKDPTATYSNSNVVDGMFAYSGAAQKTIFTAVHVKYNDKTDSYVTKTEYVANDDAIKRYGLNVKQITAFGCTSRGQAARVGKWLIETSIRERQMVSFSVGCEGIRHLPFDIIEIADNDYAGDMIGGRVLSVNANTITVDRAMSAVNSIRYYANGQSKVISVTAVQDNVITLLDTPVGIEQLGVFSATKTDVKPRLFRALSIKEDDGTYTISAVQHDENKEAVVDQGVTFEQDSTATKHKPQVSYGRVSKDGDELVISWEGTNTTQYLIKIYKDGKLYNSYTQDTAEIKLKGLSNGDYRAEIRGKSASGELTEAVIKEWSIDYDIKGLKATPELFAIKLDWTNPTTVINQAKIEIYRSQTPDRATATKVATLSYPTDTFTQNGVKLTETHHFWLRLIDDQGNTGDWVTISGQCSSDTSQIVASINGQITQTELAQSLIDSLQNDIDTAKSQAVGSAGIDAANKVVAEATARANAIQAEATARQQAMAAQDTKQTNALIAKAGELGTQITAASNVNDNQAQQLTTLTAQQGELTSGLEIERTARIAGDQAEAAARQTLVSQVNGNKTSITDLQSTKAGKTEVSSLARTALQSEWQSAAATAKTEAINAAAADAKAKADAALASAKTDAQTKADVAKSAAQTYANQQVAAKSVTDKAYADGLVTAEEQRAINDANAKLAAAKTDATTKANAAELAAKNHAELKIGEIEIGGRNLLKNSDFSNKDNKTAQWSDNGGGLNIVTEDIKGDVLATWLPAGFTYSDWIKLDTDTEYTYSALVKSDIATDFNSVVPLHYWAGVEQTNSGSIQVTKISSNSGALIANEWQKISITFKLINGGKWFRPFIYGSSGNLLVKYLKLEKGNRATDYSKAPEDVEADYTAKITSEATTRANEDGALSTRINAVKATADNAQARVATVETAVATNTGAIAQTSTKISAALGNLNYENRNIVRNTNPIPMNGSDSGNTNIMQWWGNEQAHYLDPVASGTNVYTFLPVTENLIAGEQYTASIQVLADAGIELFIYAEGRNYKSNPHIITGDGFITLSFTFTPVATTSKGTNIGIGFANLTKLNRVHFRKFKLEKGNKATLYSKAPEDVDSAINAVSSELTSFKQTTASKDSAQTIVNNQALSRINSAESSITSLQSTSVTKDKAQSTHTIKTQAIAGGKRAIAGIAIGAMANEITSESQVIVMADNFGVVRDASDGVVKPMLTVVNNQVAVNGDLIADGTILGQHIKANQTLSAPIINGGSLNINNRFKVDQFGNTTIQSSAGDTGLKITDEKIEVYDAAGRLRVRLGKLS